MGQIQQLDSSLEKAIEAYNLANVRLARIKHDLTNNTQALAVARKSLLHSQKQLSARLVDIYTSGDQNAGLAVLLGASSLDDMLGRMDASDRVSEQDSLVLSQVAHFRREVQQRQQCLQHAHAGRCRSWPSEMPRAPRWSPARPAPAAARLDPGRDRAAEGGREPRAGRTPAPAPGAALRPAGVCSSRPRSRPRFRSPRRPRAPPTVAPPPHVRRCGRDRDALPRHAVRLGRRFAVRLRLLRAS